MRKRKRKTEMEEAAGIVMGFANLVDTLFVRYTGRTISQHLQDLAQRPRELPPGQKVTPVDSDMPLADAYMVMGLPVEASFEEVERRYRNLAKIFHPDAPGGYKEAMVLLNRAYGRIKKEKRK